jgi:hypothetical protein
VTDDIVKRLRTTGKWGAGSVMREAADRIETLRKVNDGYAASMQMWQERCEKAAGERDEALAALRVARVALDVYGNRMTYTARSGMECGITRDHFGDRARDALAAIRAVLKESGE